MATDNESKDESPSQPTCDTEAGVMEDPSPQLRRDFKSRQVSMLAIAGALGTGLIIGSGTGLSRGGPASLFIAYVVTGSVIFFVMTAMGEMAAFLPMDRSFNGYASRFVDPALGFATGWNYFFKYVMVLANNLTAAGLIIQYWRPDLNVGIWVTVFAVLVISTNVLHVGSFGESEFILSSLKIIGLVLAMLTCLVIALGGGPKHDRIGFRYWNEPGAFAEYIYTGFLGRFLGFWACMVQACFAYTGTEVVGAAFAETPNPRRNIPRAVSHTLWRICVFYILGVLLLGMTVPYNDERLVGATNAKTSAAASPYVIAIQLAGIGVLPDIMNAVLLIFVISAANTDVYVGTRTLYSLARDGQAPRIFMRTTKRGVPVYGVAAMSLFCLLAYMNVAESSSTVFGYLVNLVTVLGTLNWINILVSYLCFNHGMKVQGIDRSQMPYRNRLQPYGAWFALALTILITFFNGYNAFIPEFTLSSFLTCYLGIVVYLGNICTWKVIRRTKRVKASEMDLVSGRREFEEEEMARERRS
ncbi:dicarboxylic amino acid permease [Aspergillus steynii IBT 23096]|uniref:Dicarboxylic amino acid permease n=1 Tax=Aspergillus steynii IBT 23096 TaxID=1392250 RepID=A0A2I2GI32_9EURO|nr:dicarboxylic amino acid permease [Aspergillus steynii IBT 23096]PLB52536.1 dicarboxylic amino acid permease [Aspergillus steynii IBT 23096]